jgi:hypothetical protein
LFSVALLTLGVDTRHRITLGTKMRIDWSRQVAAKDICVFSWDEAPRDSVWREKDSDNEEVHSMWKELGLYSSKC